MKTNTTDKLIEEMFGMFRHMRSEMSFTNNFIHLSILQIQALMFISHNEHVSMSDLADYFRIELPSATSLVNKLCEQKLVNRYEDLKDRRLVRIGLTEDGKKLTEEAMCHRRKKVEKMLSYLSEKEKTELMSILKTLSTKLQQ